MNKPVWTDEPPTVMWPRNLIDRISELKGWTIFIGQNGGIAFESPPGGPCIFGGHDFLDLLKQALDLNSDASNWTPHMASSDSIGEAEKEAKKGKELTGNQHPVFSKGDELSGSTRVPIQNMVEGKFSLMRVFTTGSDQYLQIGQDIYRIETRFSGYGDDNRLTLMANHDNLSSQLCQETAKGGPMNQEPD